MFFNIIKLNEDNKKEWDIFCDNCNDAWFWHTTEFEKYILNQAESRQSHSFMVQDGQSVVAIVPLIAVSSNLDDLSCEFSHAGWSLPFPAINSCDTTIRDKIISLIFSHINELAVALNAKRITMSVSPHQVSLFEECKKNNLLLSVDGFIDRTDSTLVIDLGRRSIEELTNSIRSRYRRYIRSCGKELSIDVITSKDINWEIMEDYIRINFIDPSQMLPRYEYEAYFDWIKHGHGILIRAKKKITGESVGYLFVTIYKTSAFDFCVAVNPEAKELRVSHVMKYHAIIFLKSLGINLYELGLNLVRPNLHIIPSAKQIGIANLKQGFTDILLSYYIAEKFFCREYFRETFNDRINKYANAIFNSANNATEESSSQ